MIRIVLIWLTIIVGYGICTYFIIRALVFARSLWREVPYVPTSRGTASEALDLLKLKRGDSFVDIGSGNGFVVVEAAKRLKGEGEFLGVEISPFLVFASRLLVLVTRYRKNIRFICVNMFEQDYSRYNKVFLFLTTDLVNKVARKLDKELKKGSRVVSVMFKFDDEFRKTHKVEEIDCKMWGRKWKLYLWVKE